MNDNQSLRPGTVIKGPHLDYTVIKKLGQGGFGITYLVEAPVKVGNINIQARFALKEHFITSLCSREDATQTVTFSEPVAGEVNNSMRSFMKEASRLQELAFDHNNIVKINEVFEANNTAYYVMEYLEGETLADYIKHEGPLSFEQASYFLRPVAEAVAELHARHLTHYDIKPANIILVRGNNGQPPHAVLIDFGLSKHYDHDGHATSTTAGGGYSPGYSPVEQYAGIKKFIPQADVYALAATLWHCLKGKAPAEAVSGPVNTIDTDLEDVASPQLIDAMRHAMANFADQRTPDAGAFVKEIFGKEPTGLQSQQTLKQSVTPPPTPPGHDTRFIDSGSEPSTSKPWIKWAIVGAAALLGIILAVVLVLPDKEKTLEPEPVIAALDTDSVEPETVQAIEVVKEEPIKEDPVKVEHDNVEKPAVQKVYGRTSYNNFDLATICNSQPRYFSIEEWNAVPDGEKSKYKKKGVVVKGGTVPQGINSVFDSQENPLSSYTEDFIVDLNHSDRVMDWDSAISSYGNQLPDIYQAYFIAKNYNTLNEAITAFGGIINPAAWWFWTRTKYDATNAWNFGMGIGKVRISDITVWNWVRTVASIPR